MSDLKPLEMSIEFTGERGEPCGMRYCWKDDFFRMKLPPGFTENQCDYVWEAAVMTEIIHLIQRTREIDGKLLESMRAELRERGFGKK